MSVKLVLLGDSNVGKSSVVLRFAKNKFCTGTEATIGGMYTYLSVFIIIATTILIAFLQ